jgi:hypothetical protein
LEFEADPEGSSTKVVVPVSEAALKILLIELLFVAETHDWMIQEAVRAPREGTVRRDR